MIQFDTTTLGPLFANSILMTKLKLGLFICILILSAISRAQLLWYVNPLNNNGQNVFIEDYQNLNRLNEDLETTHLVSLLPSQYYILSASKEPQLQAIVDHVLENILSTPTGSSICQKVTGGDTQKIRMVFGVSTQASQRIKANCQPTNQSVARPFPSRHQKYVFIFSPQADSKVESWTNSMSTTYIFARVEDKSLAYFTRLFAHEIIMSVDSKEGLGVYGNLPIEKFGSNNCEITSVLRNPIIKYSFNTLRALQLENQILQELKLPAQSLPQGTCKNQLLTMIPYILDLAETFPLEFALAKFSEEKACSASNRQSLDLNSALKILTTETVQTSNGQQSLCDYLLEPEIGVRSQSLSYGGPRPRIGSGSSAHHDSQSESIQLYGKLMLLTQERTLKNLSETEEQNLHFKNAMESLRQEIREGDTKLQEWSK